MIGRGGLTVRRGIGEYPIAGNIYACATGDPTCGTPSPSAQDPRLSGPGGTPADQPTNVPRCDQFSSFNPATNQCEFNPTSPAFLILAALGMFALTALRK